MVKSLQIGVVAYGLNPGMVFVRVPNERGRWLLTDRAVVEVDCPHCLAVAGEPCRKWLGGSYFRRNGIEPPPPETHRYGVGVHVARKDAAKALHGGFHYTRKLGQHKPHIRAADVAELQAPLVDDPPPVEPADIDVPVTRK